MRRVIFNQKGGVGKTTIVCNLAAIAAAKGLNTLVIDLDTQGNSSQYLLGDQAADRSIADFFDTCLGFNLQPTTLVPYVTRTRFDRLSVVAASPRLEELQVKLETKQKVQKLSQALQKLSHFDAVFMDTPPAMNFYSRSALIAADRLLVPFDCDEFARQAFYRLRQDVQEIQADHNENLQLEGLVINQFQARAKQPAELLAALKSEGHRVLEPYLPASVIVKESHSRHLPLVHLDPQHRLTQAFIHLYEQLS
jgi:chromosome partitioning protein